MSKIVYLKQNSIIWIERGIIFTLIKIIIRNYSLIKNKVIIIDNVFYRKLMKKLFINLKFSKFTKHNKNNFYINIRNIVYKKDYIIDYVNNYDDFIYTNKINLVPWYDLNDPLVYYKYDNKSKIFITNFKIEQIKFSLYKRHYYNYYNIYEQWDILQEFNILKNYSDNFFSPIINTLNLINNYLTTYYYIKNSIEIKKIFKNNNLSSVINILNKKIINLNEILEKK
jgi:hypothetical protein